MKSKPKVRHRLSHENRLTWLTLGAAGRGVVIFFLLCVIAAGVFGAVTASRKILYVQAVPALVALGAVMMQ